MTILKYLSKRWHKEVTRQNFYPCTNYMGEVVYVSEDGRYKYYKD